MQLWLQRNTAPRGEQSMNSSIASVQACRLSHLEDVASITVSPYSTVVSILERRGGQAKIGCAVSAEPRRWLNFPNQVVIPGHILQYSPWSALPSLVD